ncbi:hypothetical protein M0R45_009462 [Rubus argutus]|uniref:Uncharacterized protein n=1 Tax=Rubus argutus TaxID=59490 RepID=A0AAW1Y5X0_RUBAR
MILEATDVITVAPQQEEKLSSIQRASSPLCRPDGFMESGRICRIYGVQASRELPVLPAVRTCSWCPDEFVVASQRSLKRPNVFMVSGRVLFSGSFIPCFQDYPFFLVFRFGLFIKINGTSTVEAIFLDVSKIRELQLSPAVFRNMHNLKLLNFYVPQEVHEEHKRQRSWNAEEKQLSSFPWLPGLRVVQSFLAKSRIWKSLKLLDVYGKVCNYDVELFKKYCKVYLPGGLESLPKELRYLYWYGYPLKSLPSQYFPENLVELHLPNSQVKQLWDNVQNLGSLKNLNLSDSQHLTQVPDLSGSPNIERIDLSWCTSLVEVPSYFQNLENLTSLDLEECRNIKIFRELPCNLEVLNLSGTAIEEISPSIWSHEKLHTVDLYCCRDLKNLPSSSSNITKLENLPLRGCSSLESIPDSIYDLNHLEILDLYGCEKLKIFPPLSVGRLCCLRNLDLSWCEVLESILDNLLSLSTVELIDLSETMIESIPSNIVNACGLRDLFLRKCKKLKVIPELPWQLENLDAGGCTSLKSVASSRSTLMQQPWEQYKAFGYHGDSIRFTDCLELDESARSNIMGGAQLRIMQMASSSPKRVRLSHCLVFVLN